jgi:hypothetical protein
LSTSWGIITNFSLPGIRLGIPLLKEDFKLGIEITNSTEKDLTSVLLKPKSFSARRFDVYQYVTNKEICYYTRDGQIAPVELCAPVKSNPVPVVISLSLV